MSLVNRLNPKALNFLSKRLDVLVHEFEVSCNSELTNHLFEAKLMEQMPPGEGFDRVVSVESFS
jgi:hypothetical protein